MQNKRKAEELHSVDQLMHRMTQTLVKDFQENLNDPTTFGDLNTALRQTKAGQFRGSEPAPDYESTDSYMFKCAYQLQSLSKRYRYQNDIFSDNELIEKAVTGFKETQSRLASLDLDAVDGDTSRILDVAASYIAKVLGVYDDKQHRQLCRFGSKASVGVPARAACEAARWELPISGSLDQIAWFDSEMSQYPDVQDYWHRQKLQRAEPALETYQVVESLALTLVPKTFKSLRSIMPNTTIGSYMSMGLGEMLRMRLKRVGYDIRSLQMRHRMLAQSASVHDQWTTADLSSASDSITEALVRRLFPADWFAALKQCRIGKVTLPDSTCIESLTFCTMGIGYTFPLQTLVFLSLLKAIAAINWHRLEPKVISVYGDDMIYESCLHQHVLRAFPQVGFILNVDKTFAQGAFRESCGGDYFRGVDVRPFQPRNGTQLVPQTAYEAVLYKYINGLLMRWTEYEIAGTLQYLTSELEKVVHTTKLVPNDYPDDAGVRCSAPRPPKFLEFVKCATLKHLGHGIYRFTCLRFTSKDRKEVRHEPYYWVALRSQSRTVTDYHGRFDLPEPVKTRISLQIEDMTGVSDTKVGTLIQRKDKPNEICVTSDENMTCHVSLRTSTYVVISHTGRYTRQQGTSTFEVRS